MKKIILASFLLVLSCLLMFSCGSAADSSDDSTQDLEVTSPDGFEDVTAPPISDDTTATPETTKEKDTTKAPETTEKVPDTETKAPDTETEKPVETTDAVTEPSPAITNAEEAVAAARAWLGESDPDIGYKYAYSYDGTIMIDDVSYFNVRVSWYIEEQERYSLCGYLLVSDDGSVQKYSW